MGRAPCCDKANVKRGPWSPDEDTTLKNYVEKYGTGGNWIALPRKAGLKRCGKSCRLRWLNYLRPDIKHGGFTEEEDNTICTLYNSIGSRWSVIASQLPGRTDNDVKNYWNTKLKKKLLAKKASLNSNNHSNFTTNNNFHLNSTPASLTEAKPYEYGFTASLNTSFITLPLSNEAGLGQNVDSKTLVSYPTHFSPVGLIESSYSLPSSQEVSGLSASSSAAIDNSYLLWPGNGGAEDDGFLTYFGFSSSHDLLNGFGFQEKTSEIAPNLANSPFTNLLTSGPDTKPQGSLYQSVTLQ